MQDQLQSYVWGQFQRYVRRYQTQTNAGVAALHTLSERDAWHLFETHTAVGRGRAGKRYKDWMSLRARGHQASRSDGWRSAASVLARDVVREHLRREYSSQRMEPRREDEASASPAHAACPCPAEAMDVRDQHRAAGELAERLFGELSARVRLVLFARTLGLPASDARVRAATQASRSVLYEALRDAMERIADVCRARYPGEADVHLIALGMQVHEHLHAAVSAWGERDAAARALRGAAQEEEVVV